MVSQRRAKKCKSVSSTDNAEERMQTDNVATSNESELVKDTATAIDVETTNDESQEVVVTDKEETNQFDIFVCTIDETLPTTESISNHDLEVSSTTDADIVGGGGLVDDILLQKEQQQLCAENIVMDQTQLVEDEQKQEEQPTQINKDNKSQEEKDKVLSTLVADEVEQQDNEQCVELPEKEQQQEEDTNTSKGRNSDDQILDNLCESWIPGPSELTNSIQAMKNATSTTGSIAYEQSLENPIETTLVSNSNDTTDGNNILITSAVTDDNGVPLTKTNRSITSTGATAGTTIPLPEQVQELELIVQEQASEITLLKVMYERIQREMNDKTTEISKYFVTCQKQFVEQSNIVQLIQNTYEEKYAQQCNEVNVLKELVTKRDNDIDVLVQECKNNTVLYNKAQDELENSKQLLRNVCYENQLLYKNLQILQNEWDTTAQQYVIDLEQKITIVTNNINDILVQKEFFITEKKQRQVSNDKMGKVVVDLVNQFELVQEQVLQYIDTMNSTNDYIRYEHSDRLVQQNEHYTLIQSLYFRLNHIEMLLEHYEDDVKTVKRNVHTTHTQLLNNISTHNNINNNINNTSTTNSNNMLSPSPIRIPSPFGGFNSNSSSTAGGGYILNKNYNSINNSKIQPLDPVLSPKVLSPTSIGSNKSLFDDCITNTTGTNSTNAQNHENNTNNNGTTNSTNDITTTDTTTDSDKNTNNTINSKDSRDYHEMILGYSRPHEISMLGTENSKLERLAQLVTIQSDMISSKQTNKLANNNSSSTCSSIISNSKDIMKGTSNSTSTKKKSIHNNFDIDIDDLVTNGLQMRLRAIENIKSKLKEQIDIIQITKSALTERNAYDDDYYDDTNDHVNHHVNDNSNNNNNKNNKIKLSSSKTKSFVGSDHSCLGNGHNTLRDIEYKIKVWNKLCDDNNRELLLLSEELQQQNKTTSNDTTNDTSTTITTTGSTNATIKNNNSEIEQQEVQLWIARAEKIQMNLQYHSDDVQYIKKQIFNSKVLCDDVYHADIDTIIVRKTELNILLEQTRTQGSKIDRILLQLNNIVTNTSTTTSLTVDTTNNNDNPALLSIQQDGNNDNNNNNNNISSSNSIDPTIYNTFNNIKYTIYELDIQIDTLLNDVNTMIDKRTNLYTIEINKINKQLSRIQSIEEKFNIQTYEMTQVFMKHSKLIHPTKTRTNDDDDDDDDDVDIEQTSIPDKVSSTGTFTSNSSSSSASSTSSRSEKHGDNTSHSSGSSHSSGDSHSSCSSNNSASTKTGRSHSSTSTTSTKKSNSGTTTTNSVQFHQQQQQQQQQQQKRSVSLSPNKRKQHMFRFDYNKETQLIQQKLQQQTYNSTVIGVTTSSSLQQEQQEQQEQVVVHVENDLEELVEERVDDVSCRRSDDNVYNQYENGYEQRE